MVLLGSGLRARSPWASARRRASSKCKRSIECPFLPLGLHHCFWKSVLLCSDDAITSPALLQTMASHAWNFLLASPSDIPRVKPERNWRHENSGRATVTKASRAVETVTLDRGFPVLEPLSISQNDALKPKSEWHSNTFQSFRNPNLQDCSTSTSRIRS